MKLVKAVKVQARHPLQISVLVWWILACVAQLVVGPPPGPRLMDPATQFVLMVLLLLSSLVCLVGSLLGDVSLGLALELWGWVGICVLFLIYGAVVVTATAPLSVTLSAIMFPAFIAGAVWRIIQIRRAQRRLKMIVRHEIEPL